MCEDLGSGEESMDIGSSETSDIDMSVDCDEVSVEPDLEIEEQIFVESNEMELVDDSSEVQEKTTEEIEEQTFEESD